jgi:hypothetical protein
MRWVRSYLGYYLRLGEDDRRSVLENSPLSRCLAPRKDELFKTARYTLNALTPSSVKVSKVGLRMLPLLRSDPLWPEFPPFMLDVLKVVDSPAESPKCVVPHKMNKDRKPLLETVEIGQSSFKNRIVGFCRDKRQSGTEKSSSQLLGLIVMSHYLVMFEFEFGTVQMCYLILCSLGESRLLVSWCAGGRCGMACSDEDRGRSRRPSADDRGWSHRSGTRWPGDREVRWRCVRSAPCTWKRGARVS